MTDAGRILARQTIGRIRCVLPGRADLRTIRRQPGRDLLAGVTVAVVALPLALGFGVASGLGAAAGLTTAIVAGTIAAVFGGSDVQVSGPTGAMTVVLVPIMAKYGTSGVLTVGLLAGALLVTLGVLRAGRYIRYVPAPVIEGFSVGIAAVIFLQQVPAALGVTGDGGNVTAAAARAATRFATHPHWPSIGMSAGVAALILLGARWRPRVPFSLLAVAVATIIGAAGGLDLTLIGKLPATLPAPSLAFFHLPLASGLLTAAVAVASLAAIESLLSASVADGMTVGARHDPDRELFGQGLANLVVPMFGGVPATAAIARTAVNVRSGAASRLAAAAHALVLAAVMLVAAPLVAHVPLAALAGVLLATAVRMIEAGSLAVMARASRSDALVMVLTAVVTLALDVVKAVLLGLIVAGALALRSIARATTVREVPLVENGDHTDEELALLRQHIAAYRIDGPLFFAVAQRFLLELTETAQISVVILRLSRLTAIDATGALVLRDAIGRLEHRGTAVHLSGIRPEHERALNAVGILDRLRTTGRCHASTPEAITAARADLHTSGLRADPERSHDPADPQRAPEDTTSVEPRG